MEKKHIKILEISRNSYYVYFQIIEQTHRGDRFGRNGNEFKAKDIVLSSQGSPEFAGNRMYMRGSSSGTDDRTITVEIHDFDRIKRAIVEYNKYFGTHDVIVLPEDLFTI